MRQKLSEFLIIILLINLLLPISAYAESTWDIDFFINGQKVNLAQPLEKVHNTYYLYYVDLMRLIATTSYFDNELMKQVYSRGEDELQLFVNSNVVFVNKAGMLYDTPMINNEYGYFISIDLIGLAFGNKISFDYINNRIDLILKDKAQEAECKYIRGVVSLPSGMIADDNCHIRISVNNDIYNRFNHSEVICIPQGENEINYEICLPYEYNSNIKLRYNLLFDSDELYRGGGYYSHNGVTVNQSYADTLVFNEDSAEGIDFTLMTKTIISGDVYLPNNKTANTDIRGGIYAVPQYNSIYETNGSIDLCKETSGTLPTPGCSSTNDEHSGHEFYSSLSLPPLQQNSPLICSDTLILIEADNGSSAYTIGLPNDIYMTGYLLKYSIYQENEDFYYQGYYHPNGTTSIIDMAYKLNTTVLNTDITILDKNTITGVINKPQDVTDAMRITITALPEIEGTDRNDIYSYAYLRRKIIYLEDSQSSIEYSIDVPEDITDYLIRYNVSYKKQLVDQGYYTEDETVYNINEAQVISVTDDINNIDITLLDRVVEKGQEIDILSIRNQYNNSFPIENIYNMTELNIQLSNDTGEDLDGFMYVSFYDNNKLLYILKEPLELLQWEDCRKKIDYNHENLPSGIEKIKIIIWDANDCMVPMAKPFEFKSY